MSDVLVGAQFDAALEEAKTIARKHAFDNVRLFSTTHEGNVTKISIFGGEWVWVIDRDQKRIYEVSKIRSQTIGFGTAPQPFNSSLHMRESSEGVQLLVSAAVGGGMQERWKAHVFSSFHSIMEAHMLKSGMLQERHCNTEALEAMKLLNGEVTRKVLQAQQKKLNKAVMTVINTCWGKGIHWLKAVRVIGKELWKHLDQEVAKLTLMANGRYSNGVDYNLIWKFKDEVVKVAGHSPSLLPIWLEICKRPPREFIPEMGLDWVDGATAQPKTEPKSISFYMGNIVESVQMALNHTPNKRPLTKSAWRYLLKLKPLWVECLVRTKMHPSNHHSLEYERRMRTVSPIHNMTDYLNLCAEVGELPSYTFFLQTARHIHGAGYSPSFVSFMRAAFKASKKKPRKTFMETQFSLAYDWWKAGNHNYGRLLDKNQMRADWSWFMRQQSEWHTAVALNEKLKYTNETWFNLVPTMEVNTKEGPLRLVPLGSTYELFDEGKAMHHCVGSYSYSCENGSSRIYSIRKGEEILATVELKKSYKSFAALNQNQLNPDYQEDDEPVRKDAVPVTLEDVQWSIAQTRGPCNKEVSESVKAAAMRLKDEYTKAWQHASDEDRAKHRNKPGKQAFVWNDDPVEFDQIQPVRAALPAAPVHGEMDWAF